MYHVKKILGLGLECINITKEGMVEMCLDNKNESFLC